VNYSGTARIDGVPGTHAPVNINFEDVAGSSCGSLLPTGNAVDVVSVTGHGRELEAGVEVTLIDNGMPVVCLKASDFGVTGYETPAELEANLELRAKVEAVRLAVGERMNLGDVANKTVPKMTLVSPARNGGLINTRTFIPHRAHEAIGVLGAVSVATACMLPGSVAAQIASSTEQTGSGDSSVASQNIEVEHPTGFFTVQMEIGTTSGELKITKSALLRTARLLMSGNIFVPESAWEN
jgi:4-oxalomesaconate tautomerase